MKTIRITVIFSLLLAASFTTSANTRMIRHLDILDAWKNNYNASHWIEQGNLQAEQPMYGDVATMITRLPAALAGADWIQTAYGSRNFNGPVLATFQLIGNAEVYILHAVSVVKKPEWLKAYRPTGLMLTNSRGQVFEAFDRVFHKGDSVKLGGNGAGDGGMYIVAVKPIGASPVMLKPAGKVFDILNYGAVGNAATINTTAIQRAIDDCNRAGGGAVYIHHGIYKTGTLELKDHVNLFIEAGSILRGSADHNDYRPFQASLPGYRSNENLQLIYAEKKRDVSITGGGIIDGYSLGAGWPWKSDLDEIDRPRLIRMFECRNILIQNVTLIRSSNWTQYYEGCDSLKEEYVRIRCYTGQHNQDGIDISGCNQVSLKHYYAITGDDAVCIKAMSIRRTQNLDIENIQVRYSNCHAIKIGTETHSGVRNVHVKNVVARSRYGAAIESVDGAAVENIVYENICFSDCGVPIFIRLGQRSRTYAGAPNPVPISTMKNITVRNISNTGIGYIDTRDGPGVGSVIAGVPGQYIENLLIENCDFLYYGSLKDTALVVRDVPENIKGYPEFNILGVCPAYGLYTRHVRGLQCRNVKIRCLFPDVRPAMIFDDVDNYRLKHIDAESFDGVTYPFPILHRQQGQLFSDTDSNTSASNKAISCPVNKTVDICIYGGTSAGVIAAYSASRLHKSVLLIEPGNNPGGLSSGGLGRTDIGNKYIVTGLSRDFYRRLGKHYGKLEQWTFEPGVAEKIFREYIARAGCEVLYGRQITSSSKKGAVLSSIQLENSDGQGGVPIIIHARQFIDCSYEGDLMASAGVSYALGREANTVYNETVSGVQLMDQHQFPDGIDPYKLPAHPESGLLWGVSTDSLAEEGSGDKKIQAYNFRICLSSNPANQIAITRPDNYDSSRYELLLRYLAARPAKDLWSFLKMDLMPNSKTDINNFGPFSTDMIGMNYQYPEGSYQTRKAIFKQHVDYTKGLLYFAGHDPRMPENLRKLMLAWGYPKDEYTDNGHWSPQLYIREARRMKGVYVMTQANCLGKERIDDWIAMAAYTMDSHNAQRLVVNGMVKNEGDVQLKVPSPYPVSYRSITPCRTECTNLLVPVCLSASHMAYGSIRMEPVFMVIAQSAAIAASLAIDNKTAIQDVPVTRIQQIVLTDPLLDKSIPEILVDNDDTLHMNITGDWKQETVGGYGPSYLVNGTGSGTVSFKPVVKTPGQYQVYLYCPKLADAPAATTVSIFNGQKVLQRPVLKSENTAAGRTSGEWILLTTTHFSAGKNAYIRVSTEGAKGSVVADALLLVPLK